MHPLVRGAAASAALFALGSLDRPAPPRSPVVVPPAAAGRWNQSDPGTSSMAALCGLRTVPEGDACVPLPALGREGPPAGTAPTRSAATRAADVHEYIPRRPDRPADPAAYQYPLGAPGAPALLNGNDLGRLDESGRCGIDLAAERGEPVALVPLEGQEGDAEVVFVGELLGTTVATTHRVREAGRLQEYAVLYGHLDRPGPDVAPGARLAAGAPVGFAGDSGSPGVVHLRLEVRKVREGGRIARLDLMRLTIPCDPRNVLPLTASAPPRLAPLRP